MVIFISHVELGDGKKSRVVNDIIEVKAYDSLKGQYILYHVEKNEGGDFL